ncbi:hypothetical protein AKJ65_05610 [candidate division MSBL1 archaeon SCGC-AAA259E19]|uniref:Squalene cyclase C-terminal domain-containing protein n=1 Tax=candidate division MSBL1 archaeon SCGC-AAA259E19 TaxID=1698264 RepID=A0A133UIN5_9EURY|nr:hypothetical protein AKJ65_05610 [candidate division MSBL1 archaeon SCGC-AAA259E19]
MRNLTSSSDLPLRDYLFNQYLRRTADWLLGEQNDDYLLAQAGNSNWECSFSIFYLLGIYDKLENDSMKKEIERKVPQTVSWIINQANEVEEDGHNMAHWDGVTWDTSVVIRSTLMALEKFPDEFPKNQKDKINNLIKKSLKWLAYRFSLWEKVVTYPYGPADIAQILITSVELYQNHLDLFSEGINPYYSPKEFMQEMAQYLNRHCKEIKVQPEGESVKATFWGDPFQSAEVACSLAEYFSLREKDAGVVDSEKSIIKNCKENIDRFLVYIESKQEEGRWGTHSDTLRTIWAYLRVTGKRENKDPEPHLALKAIRWICDEKQSFDDGSYLHTMFLTVFYSLAVLEVYKNWNLAEQSMIEVFDNAMWATPVRSTEERSRRLRLEMQIQNLKKENEKLSRDRNILIASGLFVFLFSISVIFPILAGWLPEITNKLNLFFSYLTLLTVIDIAIVGGFYREILTP